MQSNLSERPSETAAKSVKPLSVKEAMKLAQQKAQTKRTSSVGSAQESLFVTAMDTNTKQIDVI